MVVDETSFGNSLYARRDILFRNGASREGAEVHSGIIRKTMLATVFVNLNARILLNILEKVDKVRLNTSKKACLPM